MSDLDQMVAESMREIPASDEDMSDTEDPDLLVSCNLLFPTIKVGEVFLLGNTFYQSYSG